MRSLLKILILSGLLSCGAKESSLDYGKMGVNNLIQEKGEPILEENIPIEGAKILHYPNNEKYQVERGVVTHGFTYPKGDQENLIYWQHKFRDCSDLTVKKISSESTHQPFTLEMKCPSMGLSVLYFEGSDAVTRIVAHEKE